jgi:Domain of unknown function (DUF4157)
MSRAALQHAPQSARTWASHVGALRIGPANDAFEQEADQAAEQINSGEGERLSWSLSRVGFGPLQRKCACGGTCDDRKGKTDRLQRKPSGAAPAPAHAPDSVGKVLSRPGSAMDGATRAFMESRFGYNFGRVRIHHDDEAAASASDVSANAFTVGSSIVFNRGKYAPNSNIGRRLLAHELAHTVQQSGATSARDLSYLEPSSGPERAAEAAARAVTAGRPTGDLGRTGIWLARMAAPPASNADVPTFGNLYQDEPLAGYARKRVELIEREGVWYENPPGRPLSRASGNYDFVVQDGRIFAVKSAGPFGHTEAAKGGRVEFAGQIEFGGPTGRRGIITRWTNASGHYAPVSGPANAAGKPAFAAQAAERAGLPMDRYVPYTGPKGEKGPQLPVFQNPPPPGGNARTPEIESPPPPQAGSVPDPAANLPAGETPGAGTNLPSATDSAVADATAGVGAAKLPSATESAAAEIPEAGAEATVAGGLAKGAAELAIGVAFTVLVQLALAKLLEAAFRADIANILEPQIAAKLAQLKEKIDALRGTKKLFIRVTWEFRYHRPPDPVAAMITTGAAYELGSVRLVNIHPGNEELDFSASKGEDSIEPEGPTSERVREWISYSVLLDDPQKRQREKENAEAKAKLTREAAKKPAALRAAPSQPAPPLLPTPGPEPPSQTFTPLPGSPGMSPIREAENVVANFKNKALQLVGRGNAMLSGSPSQDEINAFKHDEDLWRAAATLVKNHYVDNGPDVGTTGMDEVLKSDQYGGRLKEIRSSLGG